MHRIRRLAGHVCCSNQTDLSQQSSLNTAAVASTASTGPMAGICVIDLSSVISGPWAASFLADQGADVIKVEDPKTPDLTRGLGPNPGSGMGAMFVSANRGKRSMTLDLQKPEGLELLKQLVRKSDVVVMNYRPGVAEKLGCDYGALSAVNPDIIVMTISGFGPTGPYADLKVYDQVVQAMTGVPSIMSDGSGKPVMFHNTLVDKVCALNAAQAITAALLARERGRGGQHIELSMMDSCMHFLFPDAYWNKVWTDAKPVPMEWRNIAQNSEYEVADGKVTITATDKKQVLGLLEVTGLQELKSDSVGKMRAAYPKPARERLAKMSKWEIFEKCRQHGVPCGVFQSQDEALSDPQVKHNGTVEELVDPKGGRYRAVRPPARFSGTPSSLRLAPRMGADTAAIMSELGISEADVQKLKAGKII